MKTKNHYRYCYDIINGTFHAWLLDKFGNKYYFNLIVDDVGQAIYWRLNPIPELSGGSLLLEGHTVKSIIQALNELVPGIKITNW